jgi:hypothetical protein
MLCGDEIQAAVVDIGSCSSKFGFAGPNVNISHMLEK